MPRKSREEAARTRATAVESASRLFRERGIDSVSVNDVMQSLGMTAGGFYRHFESKEALAAEACAAALSSSGLAKAPAGVSAEAVLRGYLSKGHRDAAADGCPLAALVSDVPRQPAAVRDQYTNGVKAALARLAEVAPGADPATRYALMAGLVGALAIARAVNDEELSAAILRETRQFWTRALEG